MRTAGEGDIKGINALLDEGADVNAKDGKGRTALMMASYNGQNGAMEVLIAHGANVSATDQE